jgi:tetratricopeptide (TPR) repeat protein
VLVATFFLALLDRQTFAGERAARFSLDAVLVPGGLLTRYRHGPYHVTIAPGNGGLLSDRAAQERWPVPAEDRAAGLSFRTLSRSELAGLLLAELARAHGAAGNEALEERYWRAAASFFPDGIDIRLRLARVLLRTGQAADAESHIAEVVRQCPRRGDGHFLNGVALFALGRDEEAQRAFEEALERGHSEDGKLWLYLARLAAKRRSIEELREDLIRFRETSGREDLAAEIEAVLDELRVAEAVRMATSHGPYEGRFRAVRFLGQRPTPAGKEALIRCLEDPNLRFRAYAWETLCAIAGERFPLEPQAWWRWLARQSDAKGMALWSELDVGPLPDGM